MAEAPAKAAGTSAGNGPPESTPVMSARGNEEQRRRRGREHGREVHPAIRGVQLIEPLGKGHREQEREQHLYARQRDAKLVEQLDQLTVGALARALPVTGAFVVHWIPRNKSRPPVYPDPPTD